MRHETSVKRVLGITMAWLLLVGGFVVADDPTADLGSGTYAYQTYDNSAAGPDELNVKSDRTIKATGPCFAFPDDGIEIAVTNNQGTDIVAANATGRSAGDKIFYTIQGDFVAGGGTGPTPCWEAEYGNARIIVTKVPDYVYANATGYIPIQFKITGLGSKVDISDVTVSFFYDTSRVAAYPSSGNAVSTTARADGENDGTGPKLNTADDTTLSDEYIVWVSPTVVGSGMLVLDADDINDNVAFHLYVTAKEHGSNDDEVTLQTWRYSQANDPAILQHARPKIYGTSRVAVVELGEPQKSWSIYDGTGQDHQRQERIHAEGEKEYKELGSGTYGVEQFAGKAQARQAPDSGDNDEMSLYVMIKDSGTPANGYLTNEEAYTLNRYYGETIGTYFGVSYGLRDDVQCLPAGKKGVDLAATSGPARLYWCEKGKYECWVDGPNNNGTVNWSGITSGMFAVAWGLSSTGWGVPAGILSGLFATIAAVDLDPGTSDGSAYCWGEWRRQEVGGATHTYAMIDQKQDGNGTLSPAGYVNMNKDFSSIRVGETYVGVITVGASVSLKDTLFADNPEARGKYYLTEGTFTAGDAMKVDAE